MARLNSVRPAEAAESVDMVRRKLGLQNRAIAKAHSALEARIKDLEKENSSLVGQLYNMRCENIRMTKKYQECCDWASRMQELMAGFSSWANNCGISADNGGNESSGKVSAPSRVTTRKRKACEVADDTETSATTVTVFQDSNAANETNDDEDETLDYAMIQDDDDTVANPSLPTLLEEEEQDDAKTKLLQPLLAKVNAVESVDDVQPVQPVQLEEQLEVQREVQVDVRSEVQLEEQPEVQLDVQPQAQPVVKPDVSNSILPDTQQFDQADQAEQVEQVEKVTKRRTRKSARPSEVKPQKRRSRASRRVSINPEPESEPVPEIHEDVVEPAPVPEPVSEPVTEPTPKTRSRRSGRPEKIESQPIVEVVNVQDSTPEPTHEPIVEPVVEKLPEQPRRPLANRSINSLNRSMKIEKKSAPIEDSPMPEMKRRRSARNTSVNYALPSLRSKMRRQQDQFLDAVPR